MKNDETTKVIEAGNETDDGGTAAPASPINISLDDVRLSQDYAGLVDTEDLLVQVPVKKPPKQAYFRVMPGQEHRLQVHILEDKQERESYLVAPNLRPELVDELVLKILYLSVDRADVVRLWPVRLPGPDGRLDSWNEAAHAAARVAEEHWIRLIPNMAAGTYKVRKSNNDLGDPSFPTEMTLEEIVNRAFEGRYITDRDHPLLKRLRGEV